MRRFAVVTTCSLVGWKQYGSHMVESFCQFWPADVPLTIYSEDVLPVETRPMPQWLTDFKVKHRDNPDASGHANRSYNYARDCIRFAHKVAAVADAAMTAAADVLIWEDADTLTHAPVTTQWLDGLLPKDCYIAWLDRAKLYPECGFYMLSIGDPANKMVMQGWVDLYVSGAVFGLSETHDCMSLQKVIGEFEKHGVIKVHSLSGDHGRRTYHPFVNSRLAECLDHLKGPRKKAGRSHKSDLVGEKRKESHWQ